MSFWRFHFGPWAFSAQASIAPAEPAGELFCFAECLFKGETCQKSGGFHQLERGLRGGRGDARNLDFADLALCSSATCRFSSEGRTTPSRCLLLMKTTRFLAGLPQYLCTS